MRIVFLDYLRVAAIFMVLLVHACELYYFGGDGGFYIASQSDAIWVTVIDSACRVAVPLFVMASAYLLFPVTRPTGEFLKRRVLRVGVPFLLWAIVYTLRYRGNLAALCFNFPNEAGHLWFVPMILGVYLVMPMLSPWVERMSEKELKWWIFAWLVTTLFPYVRHIEGALFGAPSFGAVPYLYGECPWNGFGTFHYISGFVGYMLLGHWFRKYYQPLPWRRTLVVALTLGIMGWLVVAGFFFFRIPDAAGYPVSRPYAFAVDIEMSWEYCSLGVVMMVVAWFLILRKHIKEGWIYMRIVRPLSEASFGIYLVHMFILAELALLLKPRLATPLAIVTIAGLTFIVSSLVALALRKIPKFGKWICGFVFVIALTSGPSALAESVPESHVGAATLTVEPSVAVKPIKVMNAGNSAPLSLAAPRTFCNPLSLPELPRSVYEFGSTPHRQVSDPAMLRENGVWYVYPSAGGIWTSVDDGGTWRKDPKNNHWRTYAPAVVKNRGRFLLIPDWTGTVYESKTPLGPWQKLGAISLPTNVPYAADPSLFSDDDGRLYFYWGCTPKEGIWGCELDAANPAKRITEPKQLIRFDPVGQPWEKLAVHPEICWIEGSWMIKTGKKYILTYSAAGTENPTYAMGAYNSVSPLGEFKPQKHNPFFVTPTGFVTGTGHGSLARDERGDWWVSYCVIIGDQHRFERRIGMDRITIDDDGEIAVAHATDEPQWLPKYGRGATGWRKIAVKTLSPAAADGNYQTHIWLDTLPAKVAYEFEHSATVRAFRLCWREGRYNPDKDVNAGPVRYRICVRRPDGSWKMLCDASANECDLVTDYRETEPVQATAACLEILEAPNGLELGLSEWTLFGGEK